MVAIIVTLVLIVVHDMATLMLREQGIAITNWTTLLLNEGGCRRLESDPSRGLVCSPASLSTERSPCGPLVRSPAYG